MTDINVTLAAFSTIRLHSNPLRNSLYIYASNKTKHHY